MAAGAVEAVLHECGAVVLIASSSCGVTPAARARWQWPFHSKAARFRTAMRQMASSRREVGMVVFVRMEERKAL